MITPISPYIFTESGNTVFRMPSSTASIFQMGAAVQGAGKEIFRITRVDSNASAVARPTMAYFEQAVNPSSGGVMDFHTIDAITYAGDANANISSTTGLYCIEGKTRFTGSASQTMGKTVGVFGSSIGFNTNGILALSIGVQGENQQAAAGVTTAARAFSAKTASVSGGSITTAYGFYCEDQTLAGTNYSFYSNIGQVKFHANVAIPAGGSNLVGISLSSTASFGVYYGSGVPTLSAAQGSIYMRSDGSSISTRMYVNTNGSTTWTNLITAA